MDEQAAAADRDYWTTDPLYLAGDLHDDSVLWDRLLGRAYDLDVDQFDGLFGTLRGLRCWGARLEPADTGVRLLPGSIGEEYAVLRARYLTPHRSALRELLRSVPAQF